VFFHGWQRRCLWLCVMACLGWAGCQRYPEMSPRAFEIAKAIDNLCNLKNTDQIPNARQKVNTDLQSGLITDREHGWLMSVLDDAEAGNWEQASATARQLLTSQQNR